MGTLLIRNTPLLGPYNRTIPRVLWRSYGGGGAVSYERGSPVVGRDLSPLIGYLARDPRQRCLFFHACVLTYLTEMVHNVVFQKSNSAQIRQLILHDY